MLLVFVSELIFLSFCLSWVQASMDVSSFNKGRESTVWGVSLMLGYLGYVHYLKVLNLDATHK
jgi:hypothetical protein